MDHKDIKEQLFALYDGELDQIRRREVEAHLAICQECQELYQRWTKTTKVFFQTPKPTASEFFVQSVMNQIHELEVPKPAVSWQLRMRWLIPAVGLAFMFILAILPSPQAVSIDTLLFQEASGHLSWALSTNAPSADETLQFVMEGQP